MFQKATFRLGRNLTGHVLRIDCAAFTAVCMLMLLACTLGCQSQSMRRDHSQSSNTSHIAKQTLVPGQRIEAVIVEPAGKIKRQRVRGIISKQHRLMLPTLGTFDTQHKTAAQLEQIVLASFNQGSNLKGTVRLNVVAIETTGLFVTANDQTTQTILSDPKQKQLLDQGNHTLWQWVFIGDAITDFPLHQTTTQGRQAILAQPAHAILAGQSLHDNVIEAHVSLNPVNQFRNFTVQLSPAAGTALKTLGQTHLEQPLLIVSQGVCFYTTTISPYMGEILVITSGRTSFTDQQIKQLQAVFAAEE